MFSREGGGVGGLGVETWIIPCHQPEGEGGKGTNKYGLFAYFCQPEDWMFEQFVVHLVKVTCCKANFPQPIFTLSF